MWQLSYTRRIQFWAHHYFSLICHALGGEGYLNFEGNEFGHPEVRLRSLLYCTVSPNISYLVA